jgi:tRNA (cytidine/uridine-2'-O-)-methyltransferase
MSGRYVAPIPSVVHSCQGRNTIESLRCPQGHEKDAAKSRSILSRLPQMPLTLVLFQPDIPQNTGTMLRACACLGVDAAIIEPAGFPVSDRHFRRAGMDYLDHVTLTRHMSWSAFDDWRIASGRRLILLTTKAATPYTTFSYRPDDLLMVGRESAGVPDEVHARVDAEVVIRQKEGLRSLNVAVAAAMVLGEALRQTC